MISEETTEPYNFSRLRVKFLVPSLGWFPEGNNTSYNLATNLRWFLETIELVENPVLETH